MDVEEFTLGRWITNDQGVFRSAIAVSPLSLDEFHREMGSQPDLVLIRDLQHLRFVVIRFGREGVGEDRGPFRGSHQSNPNRYYVNSESRTSA